MPKKSFIFLPLSILILPFIVSQAFAQTPVPSEFQFPVTIVEGVTCNSKEECRELCDDPVYKEVCAKLRPKQDRFSILFQNPAFVSEATTQLGCSSVESCKAICSLQVNYVACGDLAKKYNLKGGYDKRVKALALGTAADNTDLTEEEKAEVEELKQKVLDTLGIPVENLKFFCQVPENQENCEKLARELGIRGGRKLDGPGGCESAQSCRTYCDDPENVTECQEYEIPGVNNCTDKEACALELARNPLVNEKIRVLKETRAEQEVTTAAGNASKVEEEIANACQKVVSGYQGQQVSTLVDDLRKTRVCAVSQVKTQNTETSNECQELLSNKDASVNSETLARVCAFKPKKSGDEERNLLKPPLFVSVSPKALPRLTPSFESEDDSEKRLIQERKAVPTTRREPTKRPAFRPTERPFLKENQDDRDDINSGLFPTKIPTSSTSDRQELEQRRAEEELRRQMEIQQSQQTAVQPTFVQPTSPPTTQMVQGATIERSLWDDITEGVIGMFR